MKLQQKSLILAVLAATSLSVTADQPDYTKVTVDDSLTGAAFVVSGNVALSPSPELIASSFGEFTFGQYGPIPPAAGKVTLYKNKRPGFRPNTPVSDWHAIPIVTEEDAITFPNRPLVERVSRGWMNDVIVPGGYFFDTFLGNARGSITWWENRRNGKQWTRHDVVTGSPFAYHSVVYEDFTGDGIKDIVSVGEDAGNPSDANDDIVELHLFAGNGDRNRTFEPAVTLAIGGGSLITAYDVNNDGNMDIVSPQFFGPVAGQPFVPPFARNADTASFVWFENMGDGNFIKHAIGLDQGPGFAIVPVHNLLGDGVTRWIATNHTNQNIPFPPFSLYPEPAVYEFTPGADPRQPWAVRTLSAAGDFPVEGGVGQAAPGFLAAGDLNGNGRTDIAVSGDGARGVFWLQQQQDGSFVTVQFPDSEGYGQSGGPVVQDINRDHKNEVIFTSFDQNAVSIWKR